MLIYRIGRIVQSANEVWQMEKPFSYMTNGLATVVFDGYDSGPSIKNNTHKRRLKNSGASNVHVTVNNVFVGKQEEVLSLGSNKKQLIKLIGEELVSRGCTVIQSKADADVEIAMAAVNSALLHSTTLIGEDTDLLILLLHFADPEGKPLFLKSDNKTRGTEKIYHINELKSKLGSELCTQLLFLHAFTGSDSTSRIYGVGKKTTFQKLLKDNTLQRSFATTFTTPGKNPAEIATIGRQAMAVIFGGNSTISLANLRYQYLTKKVLTAKTFVNPERLPPTETSTKLHCLRVYYQTMIWMCTDATMKPTDWGWKLHGDEPLPTMNEMSAAPDCLLKVIHCNCKTGCSGTRCSCRKYGLPCSQVCGTCQVNHCGNSHNDEEVDSDEDE